jgi:hypothetical protein
MLSTGTFLDGLKYSEIKPIYNKRDKTLITHFISFIFIPWIRTGLQNPFGYGNSQICLSNLEASQYKVYNNNSY